MGISINQLKEMAFVVLRGQQTIRYLWGQLFSSQSLPWIPKGKATGGWSRQRSALCCPAGSQGRLDKGFLCTLADDNPTSDGNGEYCLQKCTRY